MLKVIDYRKYFIREKRNCNKNKIKLYNKLDTSNIFYTL